MGLLQKAYETFQENSRFIAATEASGKQPLCPEGHIIQKCQVEILLDSQGSFLQVREVSKENCQTIIPASEESASRTSGIRAHPLCDQLMYLSNEFSKGEKTENSHTLYLEGLKKWKEYCPDIKELRAIFQYVQKGTIIRDLIQSGLICIENGKPKEKGKIENTDYAKCLVRWIVDGIPTWENKNLMIAWQKYYLEMNRNTPHGICMITGESDVLLASNHDKGIVPSVSGAKLISANDTSNFVYSGRFAAGNPVEACSISYDAGQKAMKALRWVAANQGVNCAERTFVCWNPAGRIVFNAVSPLHIAQTPIKQYVSYRNEVRKTLAGYRQELPADAGVVVAAFDAASTGRLSLCYYNELQGSDFYDRIERWYETFSWYSGKFGCFGIRSTAIYIVANCAFGTEQNGRVEADPRVAKGTSNRLLRCMLDGVPLPEDIVRAAVNGASQPQRYSDTNQWRMLSVVCALVRKQKNDILKREEWTMALEPDKKDRSYQFGRLLALFEKAEAATYNGEEGRETNALKLRSRFRERPMETAERIEEKLQPYFRKMGPKLAFYYKDQISSVMAQISEFSETDWNKPLEDTYLMGYYLQRIDGRKEKNTQTDDNNEVEEN